MTWIYRSVFPAAFLALALAAIPAHAQLAMSYQLGVGSQAAPEVAPSVGRCAGFNWLTALGECGRELLTRIRASGAENEPGYAPAEIASVPDAPALMAPAPERALRPTGIREGIANSRAAEMLLRIGSKFRQRSSDDAETYRFTDTTYDQYLKTNGHKAVGVELHVPFH